MKKTLGLLNTRNIKGSEPLQINLKDIRNSGKRGKWWLVGASYRDEDEDAKANPALAHSPTTEQERENRFDDGLRNLLQLAREQRMNTDIRRSIFMTIMSATDYRDAHQRLLKLGLKKVQQLEIPKVLIRCAVDEQTYNPFYALLARLLCQDRKLKMAFKFTLWDYFKSMEEDEDRYDDDIGDTLDMRAIVNLAKIYGSLVVEGNLWLSALNVSAGLTFPVAPAH
jgi:nucleolar MIF4G domain-containing protein 1